MKAFLMDAYRNGNWIALWLKTPESDFRINVPFKVSIFAHEKAKTFLDKNNICNFAVKKQTYLRKWKEVLEIPVPGIAHFERFVRFIESGTAHGVPLYNADVAPEQMFLYKNNLTPCSAVEVRNGRIYQIEDDHGPTLTKLVAEKVDKGLFMRRLGSDNPDVIIMDRAFARLPELAEKYPSANFHRWDSVPIKYKGGKTYFSYGIVRYQDFAIRLHGRFLVDSSAMVGSECDVDAIMELCRLSGTPFQKVASRSFGTVFQSALVKQMIQNDFLVPYKEKPIEKPLNMFDFMKADRAGMYLDPKLGFQKDVAEIDFASMFPWLIYNHNISADMILCDEGPFEKVPNLPIKISVRHKGLGPIAIKPLLDKRMEYKRNPTAINKARAVGLKWVLVSSYGYLRFREFKLGLPTAHQAISSYARETLLNSMRLAEEHGFEVIHGIVDSLYIRKKRIDENIVKEFCRELEIMTGIPVSFEGIFKWIVFLSGVNDIDRAIPARYYGVFKSGAIKARGIEVRQSSSPLIIRYYQQKVIERMSGCNNENEIKEMIPGILGEMHKTVHKLEKVDKEWLVCKTRISKTDYKHNIPQKNVVKSLERKGVKAMPGQIIRYIHSAKGAVLIEDYDGKPDMEYYSKLMARALYVLLQPFGTERKDIEELVKCEQQMKLKK
ncbi:hypothetical protein J4227_04645 [Candidatus Woesearchaeota archaeon]|nr:hypothetical protein [Candidatus Woesearchaeota archaeon]